MAALEDSVPAGKTDTSRAAFDSVDKPEIRGKQQQRVHDAIRIYERTNEEISLDLNLPLQSVTGRVNDLARAGWVRDSGERRRNRSGRKAIVWRLT